MTTAWRGPNEVSSEPPENRGDRRPSRRFTIALVAIIILLCLAPSGSASTQTPQFCVICGEYGTANLILNVFLYIPLGMVLAARGTSVGRALAFGALLSLSVEIIQLWIPGRFTTIGDLAANVAGAGAGAWLIGQTRWGRADRSRWCWSPRSLAATWSLGATCVITATVMAAQPSIPDGELVGNWIPRLEQGRFNRGAVRSASVGNVPLPSGRLQDPVAASRMLEAGVPITLRFELGDSRRYVLFRLLTESREEAIRIDIDDPDVVVAPRYRAADLRLARPWLRYRNVLGPYSEGDTVALSLRPAERGGHELRVLGRTAVSEGIDPSEGWMLLQPQVARYSGLSLAGGALWLLLLFGPIGFASTSLGRALAWTVAPLLAMGVTPVFASTLPADAWGYLTAFVAIVLGYLAGKSGRREV